MAKKGIEKNEERGVAIIESFPNEGKTLEETLMFLVRLSIAIKEQEGFPRMVRQKKLVRLTMRDDGIMVTPKEAPENSVDWIRNR